MSIEIKITLPNVDRLNRDGWARNSIFKILEGGGQVKSSAIMSIYRSLDKRKRLDFIKKALYCCSFTKKELDEILTNHKRSRWVQTVAVIKQPALQKKNADKELEKLVTNLRSDIKLVKENSMPPWNLFYGKRSTNMRMLCYSLGSPLAKSKRNIDNFDERLLYDLFTDMASLLKNEKYNYLAQRSINLVETGTRTSLLIPFVSSENEKLSKYASERMVKMLKNGGK